MNRISDERLARLVELWRPEITGTGDFGEATELCAALRELRAYRKAVKEWITSRDALLYSIKHHACHSDEFLEAEREQDAAEATLRALEEKP